MLKLIPFLVLTGCQTFSTPSGITIFDRVQTRHGEKLSPQVAINSDLDFETLEIASANGTKISIKGPTGAFEDTVILNKEGTAVLGTQRRAITGKLGVSKSLDSLFSGTEKNIGAISTGVASGIAAGVLGSAVGPAIGVAK